MRSYAYSRPAIVLMSHGVSMSKVAAALGVPLPTLSLRIRRGDLAPELIAVVRALGSQACVDELIAVVPHRESSSA